MSRAPDPSGNSRETFRIGNVGSHSLVQQGRDNYAWISAGPEELLCSPNDVFSGLLDEHKSFHHAWPLIGREKVVEELRDFIRDPHARIAFLKGPTGVGKSRLLYAFARAIEKETPSWAPFFVNLGNAGMRVNELPFAPAVVFVDGLYPRAAHALLSDWRRRALKVIFAVNPSDEENPAPELRGIASAMEERCEIDVGNLEDEAGTRLARLALGKKMRAAAELAHYAGGNPLLITLAAWLVRHRGVHLETLSTARDFRLQVKNRFCRVLSGRSADKEKLLRLVALLSPVRWNPEIERAARSFLNLSAADLNLHLGELQASGAIQRTGEYILLVPDLIADEYLQRACLLADGSFDLYPEESFRAFENLWPSVLLRNVARLDWRLGKPKNLKPKNEPLETMLLRLEKKISVGEHFPDSHMVDLLEDLARYQPRRCFPVLKALVENATAWRLSDADLLQLSRAIFDVSIEDDLLPDCCELLWRLGRDDPFIAFPDHPWRLLADLVRYQPGVPASRVIVAMNLAESWLQSPEAHLNTPIDLFRQFLQSLEQSRGDGAIWPAVEGMISALMSHISARGVEAGRAISCLAHYLSLRRLKNTDLVRQNQQRRDVLHLLAAELEAGNEELRPTVENRLEYVARRGASTAVRNIALRTLQKNRRS